MKLRTLVLLSSITLAAACGKEVGQSEGEDIFPTPTPTVSPTTSPTPTPTPTPAPGNEIVSTVVQLDICIHHHDWLKVEDGKLQFIHDDTNNYAPGQDPDCGDLTSRPSEVRVDRDGFLSLWNLTFSGNESNEFDLEIAKLLPDEFSRITNVTKVGVKEMYRTGGRNPVWTVRSNMDRGTVSLGADGRIEFSDTESLVGLYTIRFEVWYTRSKS